MTSGWSDMEVAAMNHKSLQAAEETQLSDGLTESADLFRTLVDTAPVMVWIAGPDKLCTFFSKPWLDFTGRSMEQERGNGWTEGVHPEDVARCLGIFHTAIDARQTFTMEYRLRRADGVYRWILDNGVPAYAPDGSFAGYIGSCIDISERKEMEEALRSSEERYRAFFELNSVGASETSVPDGHFLRVNDALCAMTGYTRDELLTRRFSDLSYPEERERSLERFGQLARGELQSYSLDKRCVRKDGGTVWMHVEVSAERSSGGLPTYATSVVQDITDRKRAEDFLREANERYKLATKSGRVGVWEWDIEADTIVADDRTLSELLGFEEQRRETGPEWFQVVHPADRDHVHATWTSLVQGTVEAADIEYRIVNPEGIVWWQSSRCRVSNRKAGRVSHIVGVTVDVTERRRAEEALRLSEERYRSFFELNAVGAAEVDLSDGRYLRANDAYCQMLGYSREEILGARFVDITHPDDRDKDVQQFERLVRGKIPDYHLEKRYIRKDGSVMWGQLAVTLIRDSSSNPVSELGLVLDISEHKRAERDLQRLAARLLQSQDEERRRIAVELHDQTAQTAFAININLVQLLDAQPALDEQARSIVAESLGMGQHLLQEIRTLSYLLHPPLLDQVGLVSALE